MGHGAMSEARWSLRRVSSGALGVPRRHVRTFSIQLGPHSISQGSLQSTYAQSHALFERSILYLL